MASSGTGKAMELEVFSDGSGDKGKQWGSTDWKAWDPHNFTALLHASSNGGEPALGADDEPQALSEAPAPKRLHHENEHARIVTGGSFPAATSQLPDHPQGRGESAMGPSAAVPDPSLPRPAHAGPAASAPQPLTFPAALAVPANSIPAAGLPPAPLQASEAEALFPSAMQPATEAPRSATPGGPVQQPRASGSGSQAICQVDGCCQALAGLTTYYQRYRICEAHAKAPSFLRRGVEQRFCQQCGRCHDLSAFEGLRRACRNRLAKHNARRRRQHNKQGTGEQGAATAPATPVGGLETAPALVNKGGTYIGRIEGLSPSGPPRAAAGRGGGEAVPADAATAKAAQRRAAHAPTVLPGGEARGHGLDAHGAVQVVPSMRAPGQVEGGGVMGSSATNAPVGAAAGGGGCGGASPALSPGDIWSSLSGVGPSHMELLGRLGGGGNGGGAFSSQALQSALLSNAAAQGLDAQVPGALQAAGQSAPIFFQMLAEQQALLSASLMHLAYANGQACPPPLTPSLEHTSQTQPASMPGESVTLALPRPGGAHLAWPPLPQLPASAAAPPEAAPQPPTDPGQTGAGVAGLPRPGPLPAADGSSAQASVPFSLSPEGPGVAPPVAVGSAARVQLLADGTATQRR